MICEKNVDKLNFIVIKIQSVKDLLREWKDKPQTERKYLKNMYRTKDL